MSLVVQTSGDPVSFAGALRRQVTALDSEQAVYSVRPLTELLSDVLTARRFIMALLGGFALLGLTLATVGVYCRPGARRAWIRRASCATSDLPLQALVDDDIHPR